MVHFEGNSYKAHTACITEDQKYQGNLYREKPKKGQQKKGGEQQASHSQALVPKNAYVEDAVDADTGAVAIVDAPPRAPSPPPASHSLGYEERLALPPVNVFDFLDTSGTPNASRMDLIDVDESHMIEDSQPPAYEETLWTGDTDIMKFQVPGEEDGKPFADGFAYGTEPIRPTSERYDSYYTTPAPKSKHSRTKSKDNGEDTISKTDRKRKRNSPTELDMELVRAQQEKDTVMADAPSMLHSGLTGGLNRLLARPEFPPSPDYSGDYVENSPLSPLKRAKQGTSKALLRAQREWEIQQEKDRKASMREELAREKEGQKEKDRGRERQRKERKVSTALVKIKPKKRRDDDAGREIKKRKETDGDRRRRQYSTSPSPAREQRTVKAIEYHRADSKSPGPEESGALIVRASGELAPLKTGEEARAELFMSFVNKGPESNRGMSVNKALKRYHRERYERWDGELPKADEEKELWKSLRLKKNDRGEIVLFFGMDGDA
jgi:cell growth-regulating nucleolar protein